MVQLFYSQKPEELIQKMTLANWRKQVYYDLGQEHYDVSDNWKVCATCERIRIEGQNLESIKDLFPEAIKLEYEFSEVIRKKDNENLSEIITMIEQFTTIRCNEK